MGWLEGKTEFPTFQDPTNKLYGPTLLFHSISKFGFSNSRSICFPYSNFDTSIGSELVELIIDDFLLNLLGSKLTSQITKRGTSIAEYGPYGRRGIGGSEYLDR